MSETAEIIVAFGLLALILYTNWRIDYIAERIAESEQEVANE